MAQIYKFPRLLRDYGHIVKKSNKEPVNAEKNALSELNWKRKKKKKKITFLYDTKGYFRRAWYYGPFYPKLW